MRAFNARQYLTACGESKRIWVASSCNFYSQRTAGKFCKVGRRGQITKKEAEKLCRWALCLQDVSRNRKVAGRHDVNVVFSAPNTLSKIFPRLNKRKESATEHAVSIIKKKFVQYATRLVYSMHLLCGKGYIVQTGRCLNTTEATLLYKKKRSSATCLSR